MARRVGNYEVGDAIGQGGSAVVYMARDTVNDRDVALKELRLGSNDPASIARFLREAQLVGQLSHPNLVTVFDSFEHEGTPYIAMEYLRRGSLRAQMRRLTLAQAIGVLEGTLAALDHAEQVAIVHRDLKPENLLLTEAGAVKVADFGIAKAGRTDTYTTLTASGTTLGTPQYMAPEQAMGRDVGPPTDLYSVGVFAYELFVGFTPFFDIEEPMAVMLSQINEPIPPAATVDETVDPALSAWIDKLLRKEPAERTQTAAAAWTELEWIAIGILGRSWRDEAPVADAPAAPLAPAVFSTATARTPVLDAVTPRAPTPVARPGRRHRRPAAARNWPALAGLAVLVALAAGFLLTGELDKDEEPAQRASATGARVTDVIEVGSSPDGIAVGAGAVWAVTKRGADLRRIDPGDHGVTATVSTGPKPDSVITDGGAVYVTTQGTGSVERFDTQPELRRVSVQRVGPEPESMAIGDDYVWVALAGRDAIRRLDRDTGELVGREVPVGDTPIGIDVAERRVWVTNAGDGTVTLRREGPSLETIEVGENPRDVLEAFGYAWVVLTGEDAVVRIDPATGRRVGPPIAVGAKPHKIAASDEALWVANSGEDTISQIGPDTFREVAKIAVGRRPLGIATGEGAVWVGNADSRTVSRIQP